MGGVASGKSTLMAGILGEVPVSFPAAHNNHGNDGRSRGGAGSGNSSEASPRGGRGEEDASFVGSINVDRAAAGHDDEAGFRGPGGAGVVPNTGDELGFGFGVGGGDARGCGDHEEREEEGGALSESEENAAGEEGRDTDKQALEARRTTGETTRGEQPFGQHQHQYRHRHRRQHRDDSGRIGATRREREEGTAGPARRKPRERERDGDRERVRVCYAAQAPWVLSGTVRENILFGLPMDHESYR